MYQIRLLTPIRKAVFILEYAHGVNLQMALQWILVIIPRRVIFLRGLSLPEPDFDDLVKSIWKNLFGSFSYP